MVNLCFSIVKKLGLNPVTGFPAMDKQTAHPNAYLLKPLNLKNFLP
jgi:hypothetical protein